MTNSNIYSNKIAQIKANLKAQLEAKEAKRTQELATWLTSNTVEQEKSEADIQSDLAIDRLIAGIEAQSDEFYFG